MKVQQDAQAVKIYADAFNKDPRFYKFTRTLKLYEDSLGGEKTKLIIGTDNPLYDLIKGDINSKRK